MTTTAATTTRTVVTVDQAATLNELFVQWYKATHHDLSSLGQALRACDWANTQASAFEGCATVLRQGIESAAK